MHNATAWWIRASDGAIEPVLKHDLWIRNAENLKKWNLQHLQTVLSALTCNQEDEIRTVGLKAGLIRVRETNGEYSVQLFASKDQLRHYLQVIFSSLSPMVGPLTIVRIGNLHDDYQERVRMTWADFETKIESGLPVMKIET